MIVKRVQVDRICQISIHLDLMKARSFSTGLVVSLAVLIIIINSKCSCPSFFNRAPLVALFALTARSEATAQPTMEPTQYSVCQDKSVFNKCQDFGSNKCLFRFNGLDESACSLLRRWNWVQCGVVSALTDRWMMVC